MVYTASITSQGQVTIPKQLRTELGIGKTGKVLIQKRGKMLEIAPIPNFFDLYGSAKTKSKLNDRKLRKGFIQALAENAAQEGIYR